MRFVYFCFHLHISYYENTVTALNHPVKIFIAYARLDVAYLQQVRKYLHPLERRKIIQVWYDGEIASGEPWEQHIKDNLQSAQIILLLVSANSLYSEYFYDKEMKKALERHENKEAIVIPIILDDCMWEHTELGRLQALPQDGEPIEDWVRPSKAYKNVAEGILERVKKLKAKAIEAQKLKKYQSLLQSANKSYQNKDWKISLQLYQEAANFKTTTQIEERIQILQKELKKQARYNSLHPEIKKLLQNMVLVEGDTFQMGTDDYGKCMPIHPVTVDNFEIARFPVTQTLWRAVMGSDPPKLGFKGCDECPVERVSWDDCQGFFEKLNELTGERFRLPSEAEWEFAARGGNKSQGYTYSGSNNIDEVAWYRGNSGSKTHPVGQKKANELGLHDMSGNVWEWCEDDWHENYEGAPEDGKAWVETKRMSYRVLRGGSWSFNFYCRVAYRDWYSPTTVTTASGSVAPKLPKPLRFGAFALLFFSLFAFNASRSEARFFFI